MYYFLKDKGLTHLNLEDIAECPIVFNHKRKTTKIGVGWKYFCEIQSFKAGMEIVFKFPYPTVNYVLFWPCLWIKSKIIRTWNIIPFSCAFATNNLSNIIPLLVTNLLYNSYFTMSWSYFFCNIEVTLCDKHYLLVIILAMFMN